MRNAIQVLNHRFGIFVTRVGHYFVHIQVTQTLFHGLIAKDEIRKWYENMANVDNHDL